MIDRGHTKSCNATVTRGRAIEECGACGGTGRTKENFTCPSCKGVGKKFHIIVSMLSRKACKSKRGCEECHNHKAAMEASNDMPDEKAQKLMKKFPACNTNHCSHDDCIGKRFKGQKDSFVLSQLK